MSEATQKKNGLAQGALIIGIIALVLSFIPILNMFSIPLGITGIILGAIGMGKAKKDPDLAHTKKKGMIGLILSVVAIVVFIVMWAVMISAAESEWESNMNELDNMEFEDIDWDDLGEE